MNYTNNINTTEISCQHQWKKQTKLLWTITSKQLKQSRKKKVMYKKLDSYQTFICIKYTYATHKVATVTDPLHISNIFSNYCSLTVEIKPISNF